MSEYVEYKLSAGVLKKALENVEYKKIHDQFATAIERSLQIIKSAAQSSLSSSMPVLAKYSDTISAEVRHDAEEGRVKIIKGKEPGYDCKVTPHWKLHIFEGGTKVRKTKGRKVTGKVRNKLVREGKGHSTGKVGAINFFSKAKSQSMDRAAEELTKYLSQSIEKAFKG